MKKGFLVSSIALALSSSISNTAFALSLVSIGTDIASSIAETVSEIPADIYSETHKEEAIKRYDLQRINDFLGYNHKEPTNIPITLEDHIYKAIHNDMKEVYHELEPKMSDIKKSIEQSKLDTINQLYEESQYLENKINSGDKETLKKSIDHTDNQINQLIKYTNISSKNTLNKSKEYTDTTNKLTLEESNGYTDNIAMDLVETIHQQHDSAIDTSKKYTDKVSDKNNKANHAKFKQLESMHAKTQAQNATHFSQMDKKISKTAKQANSGIASVSAMSNIPYAMNTRFSLGAGLGNYRNGTAVAVGAQYQIKENVNLRSSVSWNNSDSAVVGAGVAIGW